MTHHRDTALIPLDDSSLALANGGSFRPAVRSSDGDPQLGCLIGTYALGQVGGYVGGIVAGPLGAAVLGGLGRWAAGQACDAPDPRGDGEVNLSDLNIASAGGSGGGGAAGIDESLSLEQMVAV